MKFDLELCVWIDRSWCILVIRSPESTKTSTQETEKKDILDKKKKHRYNNTLSDQWML